MRDTTFSIYKALAILLVVVAHAMPPDYVARFAYLINVPAFFVLAGYFFKTDYLQQKSAYVVGRFRRLYVPFFTWSVLFLLLHNLFFSLGILSEQYGNGAGGVTHPYTLHQMAQNLWSITFNMSGYDPFLGGAFWFFRTLFIASIAYLGLMAVAATRRWLRQPWQQAVAIALVMLALATWKSLEGLKVTGVAQGGTREIMAIFFLAVGFLLRQSEAHARFAVLHHPMVGIFTGALPLVLLTIFYPVSMAPTLSIGGLYALALAGIAGFLFLRGVASFLNELPQRAHRVLVFVGDNTLYVFGFHLLAFKLVSALKVGVLGLPWQAVGGHPVVQGHPDAYFWLLYTLVGVAVPLGVVWGWRTLCTTYDLRTATWRDWVDLCRRLALLIAHLAVKAALALYRGTIWLGKTIARGFVALGKGIVQLFKEVGEAIKAKDED